MVDYIGTSKRVLVKLFGEPSNGGEEWKIRFTDGREAHIIHSYGNDVSLSKLIVLNIRGDDIMVINHIKTLIQGYRSNYMIKMALKELIEGEKKLIRYINRKFIGVAKRNKSNHIEKHIDLEDYPNVLSYFKWLYGEGNIRYEEQVLYVKFDTGIM